MCNIFIYCTSSCDFLLSGEGWMMSLPSSALSLSLNDTGSSSKSFSPDGKSLKQK